MEKQIVCPECGTDEVTYFESKGYYVCAELHKFKVAKKTKKVFISYGHDHFKEDVGRLKTDIEKAGHLVWMDEKILKSGDNIHSKIMNGLQSLQSDTENQAFFIYIMTRHSTREISGKNYSYTLNELTLAKELEIEIIPIMVEDAPIPMDLKRLLYLDMRDCIPFTGNETVYQEKLQSLLNKIEKDEDDHHFRIESDAAKLFKYLKPFSYDGELHLLRKRFTGREWLLNEVREWLEKDETPVLMITGEPGTGKSALAAKLIDIFDTIQAYHFCIFLDTEKSDPFRAVYNIAYQLATQLPGYRKNILRLPLKEITDVKQHKNEYYINTALDNLLDQPTSYLFSRTSKIVVLVDALDEIREYEGNDLIEAIGRMVYRLKDRIKFIFTSRYRKDIMKKIHPCKLLTIEKKSKENLEDLRVFIRKEFANYVPDGRSLSEQIVENLIQRSDGTFQYIELIREEVDIKFRTLDSLENIETLPSRLSEIYYDYFKREFKNNERFTKYVRNVLEISFAAKTSISMNDISDLLGWSEDDKYRFPKELSTLFVIKKGFFEPVHKSLYDWLIDTDLSREFYIDLKRGNNFLVKKGMETKEKHIHTLNSDKAPGSIEVRLIEELPYHLMCLKQEETLKKIISNLQLFIWYYNKDRFQLFTYLNILNIHPLELTKQLRSQISYNDNPECTEKFVCAREIHTLGLFLFEIDLNSDAAELLEEAIKIFEKLPESTLLAKAYNDLAECQVKTSKLYDAKINYQSAIRIMWRHARDDINTAEYINNLGHYYFHADDFKKAERLYKKALKIREKILEPGHQAIAEGYYNIGFVYVYRNKTKGFEKEDYLMGIDYIKTAVEIHLNAGRYIDKNLALYTMALAETIIKAEQNYAAAIPYIEDTLAILIALHGVKNNKTIATLNRLEYVFFELNRSGGKLDSSQEGVVNLNRSLEKRQQMLPPNHPEIFAILYMKAILMLYRNKTTEAEKLIIKARQEMEKQQVVPLEIIDLLKREVNIFLHTGHYKKTKALIKNILDVCKKHFGISHQETLYSFFYLVKAFLNLSMDDRTKAIDILDDVILVIREIFESMQTGEIPPQTYRYAAIAYNEVAFHKYKPAREWDKAEEYYLIAIDYMSKAFDKVELANLSLNLQTIYHFSGTKPVNIPMVQKYTQLLKDQNDERYHKGVVILKGAEIFAVDTNQHKWLMMNICFAVAYADEAVDSKEIKQIELFIKTDDPEAIKNFRDDVEERIKKTSIATVIEELIVEAANVTRLNHYTKETIRNIIIQLLIISEIDSHNDPRETYVIQKFAAEFGFNLKEINELRRYIP
ncbi:MAG: tetratricopeptide repeat protein [Bacteroidales bacterium]|nr:tetratricopeptide repeat protein [Bacteroidales bacterium]